MSKAKSKIQYIWEIEENNDCFDRFEHSPYGPLKKRFKHRFFKTREMAEAVATPIAAKRHEHMVAETLGYVNDKSEGTQFDKVEKKWWRSKPPLNIYRTKTRTVYLCGDPFWDTQDRRGAHYGVIQRVKVLINGPEVEPLKTITITTVDGSIDSRSGADDVRLVVINKRKVKEHQRDERGPKNGPLAHVVYDGEKFKAVEIDKRVKVVVLHMESYQGREFARTVRTQELYYRGEG